ncbi:MAG TPA: gliding motility-associated C-terminal domain-containing protein, partial [Bacteroidales bacterium]
GKIYQNNYLSLNDSPITPSNLSSVAADDSAVLKWDISNDAECGTNGITYNVYVGKSPGEIDVFSPMSIISNGQRKVKKTGNLDKQNTLSLFNLDEGVYYWSVQAIDNNTNASSFAGEKSFTVCHNICIGNDTSVCLGDSISLSVGTASDIVNWYSLKNGILLTNSNKLKFAVKENDKIIAELTNMLGCTLYDTIFVSPWTLPSPNLGKDTFVCFNSFLPLNTGEKFEKTDWYSLKKGFIISDTVLDYNIQYADTVWAVVSDANGCVNSDTIVIKSNSLPSVDLGEDISVCFKDSAKLPGLFGYKDVSWSKINTDTELSNKNKYSYIVQKTDTVVVQVTDSNLCINYDTIIVKMLGLPKLFIGNDTSVCYRENLKLKAKSSAGEINWYSKNNGLINENIDSIIIRTAGNDSIWAKITDSNGCISFDSIYLKKFDLPSFDIGNDTSVCYNSEIKLNTGTGWKNVNWYSAHKGLVSSNSWFYNTNILETDSLWVVVKDYNNCVNYDTISIKSWVLPVFDIGHDTSLCVGDSIELTAGKNWKKTEWYYTSKGKTSEDSNIVFHAEKKDTIYVLVTDKNLCVNYDTIIISLNKLPVLKLPNDTSLCLGDTLNLQVDNNMKNIKWNSLNNINLSTISYKYTSLTTHSDTINVFVTDLNGCRNIDTTYLYLNQLPSVNLGNDTSICINNSVTLSINDSLKSAEWFYFNRGLFDSIHKKITVFPDKNETIIVKAISKANCINFDTVSINVNELPEVNAGNDTTICYESKISLGGNPTAHSKASAYSFRWANVSQAEFNKANPTIEGRADTIFWVEVEDSFGCKSSDTVKVKVNPKSIISIPPSVNVCIGKSITLNQSNIVKGSRFPYQFHWTPDSTIDGANAEIPVFSPKVNTQYRVIISSWECNPDTGYVNLIVNPLPKIYITPTITIGENGFAQLYAEGGSNYLWSPANSLNQKDIPDPIAKPDLTTTYHVLVTDSFGCTNEDSVKVFVANTIFIPSLFTPNNDGKNDYFKIYGFGILELTIKITDKQNNIVYESSILDEILTTGWDGNYKGIPLEEGIYRWNISGKFINGETLFYKGKRTGILTLIR